MTANFTKRSAAYKKRRNQEWVERMLAHVFQIVLRRLLISAALILRGRKLGEGGSRVVYAIIGTRSVVLKVGKHSPDSNRNEWRIWQTIAHSGRARLFARCYAISCDGRYLLMERLRDLTDAELQHRPKMPIWVTDRKRSAYGADNRGDVKLRDYGVTKPSYDYTNDPLIDYPSSDSIAGMKRFIGISDS
jgi:hypothetical protein